MNRLMKLWDRVFDFLFPDDFDIKASIVQPAYDYARSKIGIEADCKIYDIYRGVYGGEISDEQLLTHLDAVDDRYQINEGDYFVVLLVETVDDRMYVFTKPYDINYNEYIGNFHCVNIMPTFMIFKELIDTLYEDNK